MRKHDKSHRFVGVIFTGVVDMSIADAAYKKVQGSRHNIVGENVMCDKVMALKLFCIGSGCMISNYE